MNVVASFGVAVFCALRPVMDIQGKLCVKHLPRYVQCLRKPPIDGMHECLYVFSTRFGIFVRGMTYSVFNSCASN